ncbi:MAG: DUF1549 domain-containing protein, partial [Planctomycetes bacterium]|nr:DUF1549 domain-containing protein [Planctomycetota bacterium]
MGSVRRRLPCVRAALLAATLPAAAAAAERSVDFEEGRSHWAFAPLLDATPPEVRDAGWCRTPVDRFILARLEEEGLRPSPPADRRRLIRRLAFGLTGLPPSPEELETFATDPEPEAYARLVDRLLASPRLGERWARHWLDLARFAESHGFEHDYDRPYAFHYRDFVIRAFNSDLPYDTFARWQLAGDEIEPEDPEALLATGFLGAGVHNTQITKNQVEKERYDELDDMLATTGTAFLGLTLGCARCHDHKYDPIPTRDYYSLYGVFQGTTERLVSLNPEPERTAEYLAYEKELKAREEKLEKTFRAKRDALTERLRAKVGDYLVAVLDVEKLHTEEFYA